MEALMNAIGMDWVEILAILLGAGLAYAKFKGYNLKKHLDNAVIYARGAATAIELAQSGDAKDLVKKIIKQNLKDHPGLIDVNTAIMATIDPKTEGSVPPLKRFWRRAIRGQNVAGILGKIALNAAGAAAERKAEKIFED
jgi:hypothetical protein